MLNEPWKITLQRSHSREVLIAQFWPEATPEAGRNSLSVALSSLRHQLEPPGTSAGSVLRADRFSVGLNPAAIITDVAQFEAALNAGGLAQAVSLYQGSLLPGFYDDWILTEQERLASLFGKAMSRPGKASDAPVNPELTPSQAPEARQSHLPLTFSRFFGREKEITEIQALLLEGEVRLVTLTGLGGAGKTRLAIEAAGSLPGAIRFVPLAEITDPAFFPEALVKALSLPLTGKTSPFDQVVDALSAQPILLVLDNFEQLIEGGGRSRYSGYWNGCQP